MWNDDLQRAASPRLLGGAFWSAFNDIPSERLHWKVASEIVDISVGVLARHIDELLVNDPDNPVIPRPLSELQLQDTMRQSMDRPPFNVIEARGSGPPVSVRALAAEILEELWVFPPERLPPEVHGEIEEILRTVMACEVGLSIEQDDYKAIPLPKRRPSGSSTG